MSLTLTVKLTPKAARNAIIGWDTDANGEKILKCSVTAIPENGKANAALIKMLAKECKIPKSAITLISGDTSRMKRLRVEGIDAVNIRL